MAMTGQVKDVTVRYGDTLSRMHSHESATSNFATEVCSLHGVQIICRSISIDEKEDIINCAT